MSINLRNGRLLIIVVIAIAIGAFLHFGNRRLNVPEAHARGETVFTATQVFGLATGQRARFCVGTVAPGGWVLDWSIPISNERGELLLQLPETRSPANEWRCVDASRESIPGTGEPGTGRIQVAARHLVRAPAGAKAADIVGSFEIVNADGTSAVAAVLYAALHNNDL